MKLTLARDRLLWVLFAASALATAWTESEIIWLFLGSGLVALFVRFPPKGKLGSASSAGAWLPIAGMNLSLAAAVMPSRADLAAAGRIALYFAEAGSFVFGSGLAIVPFMHGGVVNQFHWLTERQFLDAVAVAMITPGPVVITVAFIGYLVAGPLGASAASVGVFLPCYLFVIIPAPYFRRFADNPKVKAFVDGVTAAATGAIAGAAFVLGRRALTDRRRRADRARDLVRIQPLQEAARAPGDHRRRDRRPPPAQEMKAPHESHGAAALGGDGHSEKLDRAAGFSAVLHLRKRQRTCRHRAISCRRAGAGRSGSIHSAAPKSWTSVRFPLRSTFNGEIVVDLSNLCNCSD